MLDLRTLVEQKLNEAHVAVERGQIERSASAVIGVVDVESVSDECERGVEVTLETGPAESGQAVAVLAVEGRTALDQYVDDGQVALGRGQDERAATVFVRLVDNCRRRRRLVFIVVLRRRRLGEQQVLDELPATRLDRAQKRRPRLAVARAQRRARLLDEHATRRLVAVDARGREWCLATATAAAAAA